MTAALKRFILWDYPRGVWQYDLMCLAILIFIAFTPKAWFRDQPRIPHSSQVASLPVHGESVFWVEPELVNPIPEKHRNAELGRILTVRTGKTQVVSRIEAIYDSEKEIKGYMAFARP